MNTTLRNSIFVVAVVSALLFSVAGAIAVSNITSNFTGDTGTTSIIGTIQANLTLSSVNWTEQNQSTGNANSILTFNLNTT